MQEGFFMEYPVIFDGEPVGNCRLEEQGLYWSLFCTCRPISTRVERLYCGTTGLGVLEEKQGQLILRRRVSKSAYPMLPPRNGVLTLRPVEQLEPWEGYVLDQFVRGFRKGNTVLFPYDPSGPCPCEPLICFFSITDGFWQLPLEPMGSCQTAVPDTAEEI